jgi:hypothetical protein
MTSLFIAGNLEHLEALRGIFQSFVKANLKLKPRNCKFLQEQVMYLGHIVRSLGLSPDLDKISSVLRFSQPLALLEILIFLELVGFY